MAVAGLGSVFAAYIDVLPSPIQQLAHVTVAAPAPPSSSPLRSVTARRSSATHPAVQHSGQPAPGAHHSTSPAGVSGQPTPTPHLKPGPTRSPGHPATGPSCGPGLAHSPGPQPKASGQPSPPSWSQGEHCTGIPTGPAGLPTLNPYVPLGTAQSL